MLRDYLVQNWALILVLLAFAIFLKATVLLDKTSIKRLYILIVSIFLLSVVVFLEFALDGQKEYNTIRTILMAVRYSATPVIVAMILFTLVKKVKWFIFIPAMILVVIDFISIFTGIVFSLDDAGALNARVFETRGRASEVALEVPFEVKAASLVDLSGAKVGEAQVHGRQVSFRLAAWRIAQVRVEG